MQKTRIALVILIWLIPIAILCYFVNEFKYGSKELNDGTYIVKNDDILWINQITNGIFKTSKMVNSKSKEVLYLSGDDFSVRLGYKKDIGWIKRNGQQIHSTYSSQIIVPDKCKPVELIKQRDKTIFVFYYEPLKVQLQLNYSHKPKEKLIHRTLSLTSYNEEELIIEDISLGDWNISEKISNGGRGLPIFINDNWFFSGEEPWVETSIQSHKLSIEHHPSACIKTYETWTSDSSVVGGGCGNAKQILKDYIDSVILPPRFFSLYNTWYDLRDNDLNAANITTNFVFLTKKLNEFGANIDFCVIDDGWFFKDTLYGTNTNAFPNGLKEISDNIASLHSKLGLWLPFSGLYLNNDSLKVNGFEEANSKYFCLYGTNYFKSLSKRIFEVIKNDRVEFFKHDFNYFDCTMPGHNHLRNMVHSQEVNMRQTAKLLNLERKTNPDIITALTTGINLSPWWLKYARILWMGGGDMDFDTTFPVSSRAESEMTYRDGKLYEILRDKETFIPLYSIMTHGIIDGKLNSVGPWFNEDQWSDYIMNYFGRGTAIRELFLYFDKLNKNRSEVIAKGLIWAKQHNEQMLNAEMILGDPRRNEVYGFRGKDNKGNCYISIRNPKFTDEEMSLRELGLNSKYYLISYPYQKIYELESFPKLIIPAESVLIVESVNHVRRSEITEQVIHKKVHASKFNIDDKKFVLELDVPDNTTANLVITINDKSLDLGITDNDLPISSIKKVSFNDAKWKVNIISVPSGIHIITGKSLADLNLKDNIKLQVRAKYLLSSSFFKETYNIY